MIESSSVPCDCCGQPSPRLRKGQEYGVCQACVDAGCTSKRDGEGGMLRGKRCPLLIAVEQNGPVVNCLACGRPLYKSAPITFVDNANQAAGGVHSICVDAYHAGARA